jgi:hypothetical protein
MIKILNLVVHRSQSLPRSGSFVILFLAITSLVVTAPVSPLLSLDSLRSGAPQSRDRYGHICISEVHAFAIPATTSVVALYEHTVAILNSCFKKLHIELCYRGTDRCKIVDLPGGERSQIVLGFSSDEKFFQFEYREVPAYLE